MSFSTEKELANSFTTLVAFVAYFVGYLIKNNKNKMSLLMSY